MAFSRTSLFIGLLLISCSLVFAEPVTQIWVVITSAMLLLSQHMSNLECRSLASRKRGQPATPADAQFVTTEGEPAAANSAMSKLDSDLLQRMERLVTVGQLSAGIAHEINNPVAYVQSNLSEIHEDWEALKQFLQTVGKVGDQLPRDSEAYRTLALAYQRGQIGNILELMPERISDSIEGVERIGQIVRDMRTLVRGGNGAKALCDLNQDLKTVINIARTRIRGGVSFHVHLIEPCPLLWCNPSQIGQVVLNILVNAVQAIGDNNGDISMTQTLHEHELEITICDDGPGMSDEVIAHAFEPFFTTKGEQEGTGMGLPLSRQLVEGHGGRLELMSEPGNGTCFRIFLPLPVGEQHV